MQMFAKQIKQRRPGLDFDLPAFAIHLERDQLLGRNVADGRIHAYLGTRCNAAAHDAMRRAKRES
jgi:hypothetical protein